MSKPTQWTTTYSSTFRDRRRYAAPEAAPSDLSYSVRTQGYYGTRADLAEHAARTAEIEARTEYGARQLAQAFPQANTSRVGIGMSGAGTFFNSTGGLGGASSSPSVPSKFGQQSKDLWTHPILPHTGPVPDASPTGRGAGTSRAGYGGGQQQWEDPLPRQQAYQYQPQQKEPEPQHHIPGYQGFIRGSQFVHGDTYGRTTRNCLSNPTSVPIEP